MLGYARKNINEILSKEWKEKITLTDEEIEEAIEQIVRDLVYNYFLFKKDVTYKIFVDNLICYLTIRHSKERK